MQNIDQSKPWLKTIEISNSCNLWHVPKAINRAQKIGNLRHVHLYLYRSVLGWRIQKSLLIVLILTPKKDIRKKPKNADVSKTCFLNNSSLANGRMMKFGPKLHIIKRIIFEKKIFENLLTSALYSKISCFADFCWHQQNLKKIYLKDVPIFDVQLWSKFHVYAISQTGVIQKISFADISIF